MSWVRQLGEDEIALRHLTRHTAKLAAGDLAAWIWLEKTYQTARNANLVDPAARALVSLSTVVADELARCVEGEEQLEWSLAYSAEHGFDGFYLPVHGARARLRLERGDWDGTLSDAESVLAHAGVTGSSAVQALVARGANLGI